MKIGDIFSANALKALDVISLNPCSGEKRAHRRNFVSLITKEIENIEAERKAILCECGLDKVEVKDVAKHKNFMEFVGKFEEYLSQESSFKCDPVFSWDEIRLETTMQQEQVLELIGAVQKA